MNDAGPVTWRERFLVCASLVVSGSILFLLLLLAFGATKLLMEFLS